ncbi:protein kinase [Thalassomonas viridans]|uniref:Protein kinase n=1 Tax=Thalassomonas viridans TaxID=137584 RepID=A0AAF0CC14_9GAMM|nr:serine/threonine-protein kinase [Thalassomonas viridans]WDE07786.1 protein kinase [Thalassomonas viridans]
MSEIAIPGYEIMELLGKGGMASVYKARHINLDREVALKIMDESLNADQNFSERFVREAKISAKLMHPNIIQVYDVGHINGHNFLSMEYICGGDLAGIIHNDLDLKLVHQCIGEMALALDFSHSKGVIHRDIKPSNILLRENGSFALADFGIARREDSQTSMTITGSVMGTPKYMSPEQAMGYELDGRSDLYSLGVVFYEMLTKKVPYEASSSVGTAIKHLNDAIPSLPKEFARYQTFLNTVMAKKPEDRYATGFAMYQALGALAGKEHQDTVVYSRTELNRALSERQKGSRQSSFTGVKALVQEKAGAYAGQLSRFAGSFYGMIREKVRRLPVNKIKGYAGRLITGGIKWLGQIADRGKAFYARYKQMPAFSRWKNVLLAGLAAVFVTWMLLLPFIGGDRQQPEFIAAQQQQLNQAEQALSRQEYVQAAQLFAGVLQNDSSNVEAGKGLEQSIKGIEALFSRSVENKQAAEAKVLLQALRELDADNRNLAAFTGQLNTLEAQIKGQEASRERIKELIADINAGLKGDQLTTEQINSLLLTQQQLENLQPENQQVQSLKMVIFFKAVDSAKLYLQNQGAEQAKQLMAVAVKLAPDHPSVRSLKASIDNYAGDRELVQKERTHKAEQVKRYLAQAKAAAGQQNYYAEAGLSAYFLYTMALKLHPGHAEATEAMNAVLAAVEQQANDALKRSDIAGARQAIYQLSRMTGQQERVAVLNSALKVKMDQAGRTQMAQVQLTGLLAQGESHLQHYPLNLNRLSSALAAYRKVLLQQPFEAQALEGYRRLSELFLTFAQERSAGENYPVVLTALEQAITLNPDNPLAVDLFNQAQGEIAEKERLLTIRQLLTEAQGASEKEQWLEATLAYARLLQISPGHETAEPEFHQAKNQLFDLLAKDISRNRLTLTRKKLVSLTPYLEKDPAFIGLYKELEFARAKWDENQARLKASIPDKLQKARALVKTGNLTLPWNNSAHYFYQQVLAIDAENAEAKKGLDRIYKQLASMADSYLNQGELKKARGFYNRLAKLAPSRPELAVLKSKMALLEKSSNN